MKNVPLLPSGNVNRRLVRQWLEDLDQETYAEVVKPLQEPVDITQSLSEMELYLQRIWGEVLDVNMTQVGMNQSLFKLGGDSMVVMRMIARCMRDDVLVTARDVFFHRTIAKLAPRCRLVKDDQLVPFPCSVQCPAETTTAPPLKQLRPDADFE